MSMVHVNLLISYVNCNRASLGRELLLMSPSPSSVHGCEDKMLTVSLHYTQTVFLRKACLQTPQNLFSLYSLNPRFLYSKHTFKQVLKHMHVTVHLKSKPSTLQLRTFISMQFSYLLSSEVGGHIK